MKFVQLGSSTLEVSEYCLGAMTWGGDHSSEASAHAILEYALDRGINFIDTSELYPLPNKVSSHGQSERILGNWLMQHPHRRSSLVIGTKVVGYMKNTYMVHGREEKYDYNASKAPSGGRGPTRHTKEQLLAACKASLSRLQTDYIDIYYLHWPDRYVPMFGSTAYNSNHHRQNSVAFSEIVAGLKELFDLNLIRNWGLSNETTYGVCQFCHECDRQGVPRPVAIQNGFSLLNRSFEINGLAEACAEHNNNIPLVGFSLLHGGSLTGKYLVSKEFPAGSRFARFDKFAKQFSGSESAVLAYHEVAVKNDLSLTELALRWPFTRPFLKCIILGATSVSQLEENLACLQQPTSLKVEMLDEIDKLYTQHL